MPVCAHGVLSPVRCPCDGRWDVPPAVRAHWRPRCAQVPSDRVLSDCRDGKNQYRKAFGVPSDDLFTAIYR